MDSSQSLRIIELRHQELRADAELHRLGPELVACGGQVEGTVLAGWLVVTAAYGATRLAWAVTNDLRELLLRHTLSLDLSFHGTHPPGELIERADGDVTALSAFVSSFAMRVVGSALTLAAVLMVVLLEGWRVGLGLVAFATVAAVTIAKLRPRADREPSHVLGMRIAARA